MSTSIVYVNQQQHTEEATFVETFPIPDQEVKKTTNHIQQLADAYKKQDNKTGVTRYVQNGRQWLVTEPSRTVEHKMLPAGYYLIQLSKMGFFLIEMEPPFLPEKIYGETPVLKDRILQTFLHREQTTGVLLSGQKGSGKTLLSKLVCHDAVYRFGIPVLMVNAGFSGDAYNSFIASIDQPAVLMYDEFEKTHEPEAQEGLLGLLEGFYSTKKLFLLTSNKIGLINENMLNRPGRLYYNIAFTGLGKAFITEYCEDKLVDKKFIDPILSVSSLFSDFSFDILQAIVAEVNHYNQSPFELLPILNTKPDKSSLKSYEVLHVSYDGNKLSEAATKYLDLIELNVYSQSFEVDLALSYKFGNRQKVASTREDGVWNLEKVFELINSGELYWKEPVPKEGEEGYDEYLARIWVCPPYLTEQLKSSKKKIRDAATAEIEKLRSEHNDAHTELSAIITLKFKPEDMKRVSSDTLTYIHKYGVELTLKREEEVPDAIAMPTF